MNLTLVSPDAYQEVIVAWIEINTPKGSYIIQPGHIPMIMPLLSHMPLTFQNKLGKKENIMIREGVVHIQRDHVIVVFRSV